jgi:hypothetical protein
MVHSQRNAAVVTLVATSSSAARQGSAADGGNGWLRGARTLGCTLQPITHLVDLVALCFSLSRDELALLHKAGWRCAPSPRVWNPDSKPGLFLSSYWAWDYTLKIVPFGLVSYERVVVVDSDTFAVDPRQLAELLSWPLPADSQHILATRDCVASLHFNSSYEIQGGLIVLRPNASLMMRLVQARNSTASRDRGGQGFISTYFRGRVTWLANRFNYIADRECIARYDARTGSYRLPNDGEPGLTSEPSPASSAAARTARHANGMGHDDLRFEQADAAAQVDVEALAREHLNSKKLGLVHFHSRPKPWTCNLSAPLSRCVTTRATQTVRLLYAAWRDAANACDERHGLGLRNY